MAYNAPEGTADMLPAAARLWRSTVDSAAKLFGTYGYEPIYTPLFEVLAKRPMWWARKCSSCAAARTTSARLLKATIPN